MFIVKKVTVIKFRTVGASVVLGRVLKDGFGLVTL